MLLLLHPMCYTPAVWGHHPELPREEAPPTQAATRAPRRLPQGWHWACSTGPVGTGGGGALAAPPPSRHCYYTVMLLLLTTL